MYGKRSSTYILRGETYAPLNKQKSIRFSTENESNGELDTQRLLEKKKMND